MKSVQGLFTQFASLLQKLSAGNELWQFTVSAVILFAGFLFLELLSRYANKRIETTLKVKGFDQWAPYVSGFLPSLLWYDGEASTVPGTRDCNYYRSSKAFLEIL
jgi:hypothetical protein